MCVCLACFWFSFTFFLRPVADVEFEYNICLFYFGKLIMHCGDFAATAASNTGASLAICVCNITYQSVFQVISGDREFVLIVSRANFKSKLIHLSGMRKDDELAHRMKNGIFSRRRLGRMQGCRLSFRLQPYQFTQRNKRGYKSKCFLFVSFLLLFHRFRS